MTRVLACVLLGACFGSGPLPSQPADATVVFAAPLSDQECSNAVYIGDVAIGAGSGFATLLPYQPQNNNNGCNNGGGMPVMITVNVLGFDKTGADPAGTPVGQAGQSNGTARPRLAADGDGVVFAFPDQQQSAITIMSTGSGTTGQLSGNSPFEAVGLAADTTAVYVAGIQAASGGTELDNPTFPCCGPVYSAQPAQNGQLASIPLGTGTTAVPLATPPGLFDIPLKQSMVVTDTSLVVISPATDANIAVIDSFPKVGGSATMLGTIPQMTIAGPGGIGPAGLAADSAHVAWSATFDPGQFDTNRGCFIWASDGTTMSMLLSTQAFACIDLAVDATSVYFTIFRVDDHNGNQDMSGIGIGRASLTDGSVESIALGFTGVAAGPRRIYLDGDDIYAVDPLVIGKLPKSALDGAHDFQP